MSGQYGGLRDVRLLLCCGLSIGLRFCFFLIGIDTVALFQQAPQRPEEDNTHGQQNRTQKAQERADDAYTGTGRGFGS